MEKNIYFDTNLKKDCNGCGACALRCPVNAIQMKEDKEGFLYPIIDLEKCIHCGRCRKICSNQNDKKGKFQTAYMVMNPNKDELKKSASGGAFFLLAKYIIQENGVVFGVKYDENLQVKHASATTLEECISFQGSKYVRSDLGTTYIEVEKHLKNGKKVLFTGTPCQCQGLKKYLKKEYENLWICDIICHANPSQKIFNQYIESLEQKYQDKVDKIDFRSKKNGWKNSTPIITFASGNQIEEDTFYRAFSRELIDRPSCHSCQFSGMNRISDITIGDFWGVEKILTNTNLNLEDGVSIVLMNTEKGKWMFEQIEKEMYYQEVAPDEALKYNHHSNLPMHKNRKKFFKRLNQMDIMENINSSLQSPFYKRIAKRLLKLR